jgi:hypothetical protein
VVLVPISARIRAAEERTLGYGHLKPVQTPKVTEAFAHRTLKAFPNDKMQKKRL